MNDCGMIPKLVEILKAPGFRALILKILYHLSQEDKLKATFTYTECIPLCFQLVIHCPEPIVGKELIALCVNLTTNGRNAEIMAQEGQGAELIRRAFKFRDTLLFKVCRNIAQFYPLSLESYEEFMPQYISLCYECGENTDLLLELLGTLVYLPTDKWEVLIEECDILEFLQNNL